MPDFQQFTLTRPGGNITPTLPQINASFLVTDSQTGELIRDFTGVNAFSIWTAFGTLTAQQKIDLLNDFAWAILQIKAAGG